MSCPKVRLDFTGHPISFASFDQSRSRQCAYLDLLRAVPGKYPGSPTIAMHVLGRGARYVFCDIDPERRKIFVQHATNSTCALSRPTVWPQLRGRLPAPSSDPVTSSCTSIRTCRTSDSRRADKLPWNWRRRSHALDTGCCIGTAMMKRAGEDGHATRSPRCARHSSLVWRRPHPIAVRLSGPAGCMGLWIVLANMTGAEADVCGRLGCALEGVSADDILASNEPDRLNFEVLD